MRLKMLMLAIILVSIVLIVSCSKSEDYSLTINGADYYFSEDVVKGKTLDNDNEAIIGVMSDIHGESEKAREMALLLKEKGAEVIFIAGDLALNEQLYGMDDKKQDYLEIIDSLNAVSEAGLPVFVIPGNHESKRSYEKALAGAPNNIIDMSRFRVLDGDDFNMISLPGYYDAGFMPEDGYLIRDEDFDGLGGLKSELGDEEPIILLVHESGRTVSGGPATIYSGKDVGNPKLREALIKYGIPFTVSGNIHEAGGRAASFNGDIIKQGEWSEQFSVNAGTLREWTYLDGKTRQGMAILLRIKGNNESYEIVELK